MDMTLVFTVLTFQAVVGAFDNLWHHELEARLPQRASARYELRLHAAREAIYGLLFSGLAWLQWRGSWVMLPAGLLLLEMGITIADFLEEDRSRKLPPLERALHTVLAVSYGLLLGLIGPVFWQEAQWPTSLEFTSHGLWSWFFSAASLGVLAWSVRNALAVRQLMRIGSAQSRLAMAPQSLGGSTVLVTGGTGFIGTALVAQLRREGRRVIVLTRDPLQARASLGPNIWVVDRLDDIPSETRIDAVVNLAGESIMGAPWTASRRQALLASRIRTTRALHQLMQRLDRKPEVLVSASAVGYYGVPSDPAPLDEAAPAEPGRFQSDLCAAIEQEAQAAQALGIRVVCLRPGIVLGRTGGAFPPLALAARMGMSAVLGSGLQPMPWIHLDDVVGLICHAMTEPAITGALNAVAPQTLCQAEFTQAMAASFDKRVWLQVPAVMLRAGLGEMSELLLCGQNTVPAKALRSGYEFRHPALLDALHQLMRPAGLTADAATR